MKRTEVNRSELRFPNSEVTLNISTEFNSKHGLKCVLDLKNLGQHDHKVFEEALTKRISDEVKKLVLKQIVERR